MMQDLRFAVRTLIARPSFTATAVLTLAIGIGATTTLFSVVDAVVLRPLPLKDPERLAVLWETNPRLPVPVMVVSPRNLADWRARTRSFEALGASRAAVVQMIVGRGLALAAAGIVAGLAAAALIVRLFATLLFGVSATDVPTYAASGGLLLGIGALASYLPARRAMRVDPVVALRTE